jgi:hypothetical protein
MATVEFYAGQGTPYQIVGGSGLGYYGGAGFASSVVTGEYADTVFITNSAGSDEGPQANNFKYIVSENPGVGSGIINGTPQLALTYLPNSQATLNCRFTHTSAILTQNAEVRIYDRTSINNGPSGVTCQAAEIIHVVPSQTSGGSGDLDWISPAGSSVILDLVDSPGTSGEAINGTSTQDTQHDHYIVLSISPDSVGSKTLVGLYYSTEYL